MVIKGKTNVLWTAFSCESHLVTNKNTLVLTADNTVRQKIVNLTKLGEVEIRESASSVLVDSPQQEGGEGLQD